MSLLYHIRAFYVKLLFLRDVFVDDKVGVQSEAALGLGDESALLTDFAVAERKALAQRKSGFEKALGLLFRESLTGLTEIIGALKGASERKRDVVSDDCFLAVGHKLCAVKRA